MEERGALPKQLSTREKTRCQDSGVPLKRRSWAILERRFHALTLDFSNPLFSPGRLALEQRKSRVPFFETVSKEKPTGGAMSALRGLPDEPACLPWSLAILFRANGITANVENKGTLETARTDCRSGIPSHDEALR
jgi:hypothetical protein